VRTAAGKGEIGRARPRGLRGSKTCLVIVPREQGWGWTIEGFLWAQTVFVIPTYLALIRDEMEHLVLDEQCEQRTVSMWCTPRTTFADCGILSSDEYGRMLPQATQFSNDLAHIKGSPAN
jgi:hypothetical protein